MKKRIVKYLLLTISGAVLFVVANHVAAISRGYDAIGVMVSYGYGAGWSTWANDINIALDSRIIKKYLELREDPQWRKDINGIADTVAKEQFADFLKKCGYKDWIYLGGLTDCEIVFVSEDSQIRIDEYDGAETLVVGTSDMCIL